MNWLKQALDASIGKMLGGASDNPADWPNNLSTLALVGRTKTYLRRNGWTIAEPIPWLNVFVRANKGNIWLALIVHNEQSLSLPVLLRDCMDAQRGRDVNVGILSKDRIPQHLAEDAERMGIFLIDPTQLSDAEAHVIRAALRRAEVQKAAAVERPSEAPLLTSVEPAP